MMRKKRTLQKTENIPRRTSINSDDKWYEYYLTRLRTICNWENEPDDLKIPSIFIEDELQEIVDAVKLSFKP
jgi:hypothetical protein